MAELPGNRNCRVRLSGLRKPGRGGSGSGTQLCPQTLKWFLQEGAWCIRRACYLSSGAGSSPWQPGAFPPSLSVNKEHPVTSLCSSSSLWGFPPCGNLWVPREEPHLSVYSPAEPSDSGQFLHQAESSSREDLVASGGVCGFMTLGLLFSHYWRWVGWGKVEAPVPFNTLPGTNQSLVGNDPPVPGG